MNLGHMNLSGMPTATMEPMRRNWRQEAYLANHDSGIIEDADVYYGKGKSKKGKGKGKFSYKGEGKFKKGKPYGGGNLSLEDRRQKLAEFKKRTTCQACGQKGHWAGDKECPRNAKSNTATANLAVRKNNEDGIILPNADRHHSVCLMLDGFGVLGQSENWRLKNQSKPRNHPKLA